jgi:hypothetical protein
MAVNQIESMDEITGANDDEFAMVEGFTKDKPFRIGSLTAGDMIEWTEAGEGEAKRTAGLRLICKSLVNSKGDRIALDPKNIAVFRAKSHKVTERIVKEILILNGMKTREELFKTSKTTDKSEPAESPAKKD